MKMFGRLFGFLIPCCTTVYNFKAVWRKRADSNLPPFFRHGFVTVVPWETLAGEQAGESVLPRSKI